MRRVMYLIMVSLLAMFILASAAMAQDYGDDQQGGGQGAQMQDATGGGGDQGTSGGGGGTTGSGGGGAGQLTDTGGPALLPLAGALLLGTGILTCGLVLRRR